MIAAIALLTLSQPVAIMIHGAGGGGWEYKFWTTEFRAAGWQVVAPDLMPAKKGLTATRFDDYLQQVRAAIRKHRGRRTVLIGASMGGILALKAAEAEPVDRLILINSVAPLGIVEPTFAKYPPIIRWANGPLRDSELAMPDSDRATILYAHRRWRDESGLVMGAMRQGISVDPPRAKALVMIGLDDTDILPAQSRELALFCDADVLEFPKTSHVGPLLARRAPEFARRALRWLDR